ncbi:MAG: HpcH/HpaI aldolase/citrate lyase family protein [Clostridiaceae bacterium]|nr:HpcH/HpaI aldolase/citrate lyase family protein [Clostridiaceae bacterium]
MRHHKHKRNFNFIVEPTEFNKYTEKQLLQYCVGAAMYMPGTMDFGPKILAKKMPGLTSIVLCFEDACPENAVPAAEANVLTLLESISSAIDEGNLTYEDVPLIFIRVRSIGQFRNFSKRLTSHMVKVLAGFSFPKFNSANGTEYFEHLVDLNEKLGEILYGMPIIEDPTVAHKETRLSELLAIKTILDKFHDYVLQVRVGATDFSSCFGVRRGVDYTIYDILTVRECLSDILNIFSRNNEYVVSGPVWEYFRQAKEMMFEDIVPHDIEDSLLQRKPIFNVEVDGLLREVILDKANGFVGRTVIHPTHFKYVNALMAVTREEYDDACQILSSDGGVHKSLNANKMNETKPHTCWAEKIYMRAQAYGVIENSHSYIELFSISKDDVEEV